jgi:hypothetical protein
LEDAERRGREIRDGKDIQLEIIVVIAKRSQLYPLAGRPKRAAKSGKT